MKFVYDQGATPITQDEIFNLIPKTVFTQNDLNVFEQNNIRSAEKKLFNRKKKITFNSEFVRKIHKEMFNKTWKWAGKYRATNTNIGIDWRKIAQDLLLLCDDVNYQIENNVYGLDEIAVRFSHRLVFIHPFPNGNGRCSRLIADWIAYVNGGERFTWGNENLTNKSKTRDLYISALKKADNNEIGDLIKFARS
jgi:Fic-DOC domain mobile mystery protein B